MKSKSKIIGLIVCIAVVAILGVFVCSKTDLFKSPKELFYKYLGDALEIEEGYDYSKYLEDYKKISQNPYNMTTAISANIKSDDIDSEITDAISNSKIIVNEKSNPSDKKAYTSLEFKYKDNEGIKAEVLSSDNQYAVKSDILHDKYISVENKNLKELFKKFGLESDEIPDEIKMMDTYEFLYVSPKDIKSIKQTYKNVIDKNISKDCYSVVKNAEITVNGEKMKANAYTITISEKQAYNLSINVLETLKSDELTLGIIEKKLDMLYENGLIKEEDKYNKEKIKELIDEMIEESKSSENSVSENDTVKITVYASKGKAVKMLVESSEDVSFAFDKFNKDNHYVLVFEAKESGESAGKITADYTVDKKGNETNVLGTLSIKAEDEDPYKFNFECKKTGNDDKYDIKLTIGTTVEDIKISLNIEESADFKSKVEIDSLDSNNSVKINDLSEEEMQSLLEEIVANVETRLPEKLQKFGVDEDTLNSLMEEGAGLLFGSNDNYDYSFDDSESTDDIEEQYNAILERYQNGEISLTEASEQIESLYNN